LVLNGLVVGYLYPSPSYGLLASSYVILELVLK
jgi:hypothetical protein